MSSELTLLLPFDQFLFSELHQFEGGQRLRVLFVSHEVTLTGTNFAKPDPAGNGGSTVHISNPAIGVTAPALMLVAVRARAPVQGNPSINGTTSCTSP